MRNLQTAITYLPYHPDHDIYDPPCMSSHIRCYGFWAILSYTPTSDIGYNIQYILHPARKMQSPRNSLSKLDSHVPSCCSLEQSVLTLDASITSFKDLSISEINDSPLSLSKIITDSDEDVEGAEQEEMDLCDDYHTLGYCLKGKDCDFEHRTSPGQTSRQSAGRTASTILINFPEMIVGGSLRRTRSFLE